MTNGQSRTFTAFASLLPLLGTILAVVLAIRGQVTIIDLALFAVMYGIAVMGVTVGYHRLLSHRSFVTPDWVKGALTLAGSIAGQGPAIVWVAHHRRHHRQTDRAGDPHSPYVTVDGEEHGGWRGLWHAHLGWLLTSDLTSDHLRYCPDLVRNRSQRWLSRHFLGIVLAGVVLPGVAGLLITRSITGGLTGMLWGGLVRLFAVNQVTYAVNSAGHTRGWRGFATPDESRNLSILALPSFGESWHNNHHAIPRSARFGLRWWQVDLGSAFIVLLERLGLAHDVVRFSPETIAERSRKLAASGGGRRARAEPPPPMSMTRSAPPVVLAAEVD